MAYAGLLRVNMTARKHLGMVLSTAAAGGITVITAPERV